MSNTAEIEFLAVCESTTGVRFSFTLCSATWTQLLIDDGISTDAVSVLLGHSSTVTTNKYYAKMRQKRAV